jgi:hypothetical protein
VLPDWAPPLAALGCCFGSRFSASTRARERSPW